MTAQNWIGVHPRVFFSVVSKSNAFFRTSITDLPRISFTASMRVRGKTQEIINMPVPDNKKAN
jgi:hypothetical protein